MPRVPAQSLSTTRRRRPTVALALALALAATALPLVGAAPSSGATAAPAAAVAPATTPSSLFTALDGFRLRARDEEGHRAVVRPATYTAYELDPASARTALAGAGPVGDSAGRVVSIPDPSGEPVAFSVVEDSVMEPGLAAAHPEIDTYVGQALDGSGRSVSMGVTRLGFFASVRSPSAGGSWYVDPAYRGPGATQYLSYYGAAVPAAADALVERGPVDTERILAQAPPAASRPAASRPAADALVTQRTFRLAFVTDPTYAAYFGAANVLSAKVQLLARTNQIYNDDLAIKFVLVDGTDQLNLDTVQEASGPDGPCGASPCYDAEVYQADPATPDDAPDGCTSSLLDRNEFVLGQIIGADGYDVGHIGLGVNGGGIAGLGVVGGGSKASGCTGLPAPTGDFYAVDYFSHEVGHQMGGNHTFNGDQINCSATNRNGGVPVLLPGTAVEPGSGSTVMAYAGICGQDNLQPHSDPYFSQRSIDEIDATVTADPAAVDELQTVTLRDFDATDSFQLTYDGETSAVLTRGTTYNLVTVTTALQQLTGCLAPIVTGYDDATTPGVSDDGFTVSFGVDCTGQDLERLGTTAETGGVTAFVGVQDDGGEGTNQGSIVTPTANHAPRVVAPEDRTIPTRTPFTLTGSGTDVDQNPLTYVWEQNTDAGAVGTSLVDNTKTDGPLFRVFGAYADVSAAGTLLTPSPGINVATGSATRTFPDIEQILAGNTNAKTGACPTAPAIPSPATGRSNVPVPTVECFAEFLPTADYGAPAPGLPSTGGTLTFRLTARDQVANGGGTQFDDVELSVDSSAGPFLVTSRGTAGAPAPRGGTENVEWDVADTDAPDLAPSVRILLSVDGGRTFPTVLAASTPNDGSQAVTLPAVDTSTARLKVEAVDNYFFAVNDADFTIGSGTPAAAPGTSNPPAGSALATRTRIRLPRVWQVQGRESARVDYAVVASAASSGSAGSVVIRIDGRKVRRADVAVTRKAGKKIAGATYRVPKGLALGRHRISITFVPSSASAYLKSRSRVVTLTVVRRR